MRLFMFFICGLVHGFAGTSYLYTTDTLPYRNSSVQVAVLNGGGLRKVPTGFYPQSEPNGFFGFQHSIVITNPGPFLYTSHANPDALYGYRRLIDGQLQLLPGFPLYIPPAPNLVPTRPIWLTRHPELPILYSANVTNNSIGIFRIQSDGSLDPQPFLLLGQLYDGYVPQAMAITPDGSTLFVNCFEGGGIISMDIDQVDGTLSEPKFVASLPSHGRGLAMSEDGIFLYATIAGGDAVYLFRIQGDDIAPLNPASVPLPTDGFWLFSKGSLLAVGSWEAEKVVIYQIDSGGQLGLAPGSPNDIFRGSGMMYAAFDPSGEHLFFGGNDRRYAFEIDYEGQIFPASNSPLRGSEFFFGVSISPETIGDPYSLNFASPPQPQDQTIYIQGEPNTPFVLMIGDTCISGLVTDEQGLAEVPTGSLIDTRIEIKAFCEDEEAIVRFLTVPTLSSLTMALLIIAMLVAAVVLKRRSSLPKQF